MAETSRGDGDSTPAPAPTAPLPPPPSLPERHVATGDEEGSPEGGGSGGEGGAATGAGGGGEARGGADEETRAEAPPANTSVQVATGSGSDAPQRHAPADTGGGDREGVLVDGGGEGPDGGGEVEEKAAGTGPRGFTCGVCLDEVEDFVEFPDCAHRFCASCLVDDIELIVAGEAASAASASQLGCPDGCEFSILPNDGVAALLRDAGRYDELYQRYLAVHAVSVVMKAPDLCYCPNPACDAVVRDTSNHAAGNFPITCDKCSHTFCFICKETWDQSGRDDAMPGTIASRRGTHVCNKSAFVGLGMKQCPRCSVWVERGDSTGKGCAQMKCHMCQHMFCWYCLADLNNDVFLLHFNRGECANVEGGDLGHSLVSLYFYRFQVSCVFFFACIATIVCAIPYCLAMTLKALIVEPCDRCIQRRKRRKQSEHSTRRMVANQTADKAAVSLAIQSVRESGTEA